MHWYQIETNLARHWKTKALANTLSLTVRDTVGLLAMFWMLVADQFETGIIDNLRADHLQDACNYHPNTRSSRDRTPLLDALIQTGFIDKSGEGEHMRMTVHGWKDRNTYHLRERERKKAAREKDKGIDF